MAGTVLTRNTGQPEETRHLKMDVTNVGYYIRPTGDVLVVGTGGGRDILSALLFGAKSVTGVELNPNIMRTANQRFGDFTGHLDRDPRVTFVSDEARSYITRQRRSYNVIQISLIDTWAATASGAFVLSENSLYTVEAWDIFLNRLNPGGILSVSRWYFRDRPAELYRSVALASSALLRRGVPDPRRHMVIVRNMQIAGRDADVPDGVGTLLVSPSPFSPEDVRRLEDTAKALQFDVPLSPTFASTTRSRGWPRAGTWRPSPTAIRSTSRRPPMTAPSSSTCSACATSSRGSLGGRQADLQPEGGDGAGHAARHGHPADGGLHHRAAAGDAAAGRAWRRTGRWYRSSPPSALASCSSRPRRCSG